MRNSTKKYVVDCLLGGKVPFEQVLDASNASNELDDSQEASKRVWPAIPSKFELPPVHLEETVKEMRYISGILVNTLVPTPLPEDDLELMSDFLLSLETRTDNTIHVMEQIDVKEDMDVIARMCEVHDDTQFNFRSRTQALANYWQDLELNRVELDLDAEEYLADQSIPPLKTAVPHDKPSGWKLILDEEQASAAEAEYTSLKYQKIYALKYWQTKPPNPLGWAPRNGNSFNTATRSQLENGDLFNNTNFRPLYGSWALQIMDATFWTDPDATPESLKEQKANRDAFYASSMRKYAMRKEREIYLKSR